jgi:hypothetical protein
MAPQLKEMIEKGTLNEIELVEFIRTLKKLSDGKFMDKRNVKMVLKHFGMKKKKTWLKLDKGTKIEL